MQWRTGARYYGRCAVCNDTRWQLVGTISCGCKCFVWMDRSLCIIAVAIMARYGSLNKPTQRSTDIHISVTLLLAIHRSSNMIQWNVVESFASNRIPKYHTSIFCNSFISISRHFAWIEIDSKCREKTSLLVSCSRHCWSHCYRKLVNSFPFSANHINLTTTIIRFESHTKTSVCTRMR